MKGLQSLRFCRSPASSHAAMPWLLVDGLMAMEHLQFCGGILTRESWPSAAERNEAGWSAQESESIQEPSIT